MTKRISQDSEQLQAGWTTSDNGRAGHSFPYEIKIE